MKSYPLTVSIKIIEKNMTINHLKHIVNENKFQKEPLTLNINQNQQTTKV